MASLVQRLGPAQVYGAGCDGGRESAAAPVPPVPWRRRCCTAAIKSVRPARLGSPRPAPRPAPRGDSSRRSRRRPWRWRRRPHVPSCSRSGGERAENNATRPVPVRKTVLSRKAAGGDGGPWVEVWKWVERRRKWVVGVVGQGRVGWRVVWWWRRAICGCCAARGCACGVCLGL